MQHVNYNEYNDPIMSSIIITHVSMFVFWIELLKRIFSTLMNVAIGMHT